MSPQALTVCQEIYLHEVCVHHITQAAAAFHVPRALYAFLLSFSAFNASNGPRHHSHKALLWKPSVVDVILGALFSISFLHADRSRQRCDMYANTLYYGLFLVYNTVCRSSRASVCAVP